jgi:uncharacterized protein (TIGR02145 family)
MKNIILVLVIPIFLAGQIESQIVKGKIVDEDNSGLVGVSLNLYINPNIYTTTTSANGSFSFTITEVKDEQLPTGYVISNNFPNPFNPTTRINITLPNRSTVKIEVFNIIGQNVKDVIEQSFNAGTSVIDIELDGLPNDMYITRITIDNKFTVVKKMMLIYGSQHLMVNGDNSNTILNKSNDGYNTFIEANLDSLVATSAIIGNKTFSNLPSLVSDTLDLEKLTIERYCSGEPTIIYAGKTYHTVRIGTQCWLKENLDVGTRIDGIQNASNNGVIEKYCFNDSLINCDTLGGLYSWNEAMQYVTTPSAKGICPIGWHMPTYEEFQTLAAVVNNNGIVLKRQDQGSGAGQGTNASGFSALLAGARITSGAFMSIGYGTGFYSSTEVDVPRAGAMGLFYNDNRIYFDLGNKESGISVRCIKD